MIPVNLASVFSLADVLPLEFFGTIILIFLIIFVQLIIHELGHAIMFLALVPGGKVLKIKIAIFAISDWRVRIDTSDFGMGGFPKGRHAGYVQFDRQYEGWRYYMITSAGFFFSTSVFLIPLFIYPNLWILLSLMISVPVMALADTRNMIRSFRKRRKQRKVKKT
ncbi:MAG: hypothetical protein ACFFC7_08095 [Candidatus Hermodarchaeota archaeon]